MSHSLITVCCASLLLLLLLQGMLPQSRLVFGDMAQPTDQVKASGNLEVVLGLTMSEVCKLSVQLWRCTVRVGVVCAGPHHERGM
jgi:hypothetical protein